MKLRHSFFFFILETQYAKSKNCMMELRFAEVTLNKPIVAVLVGQGDDYKETEVGDEPFGPNFTALVYTRFPCTCLYKQTGTWSRLRL